MLISAIWAFALGIDVALLTSSPNIVSASSLRSIIAPQLEKCPSDSYIIVSQPGVSVADYHNGQSTPILRRMVMGDDKNIRSSIAVQDVKGTISPEELSAMVQTKCGAGHLRVDASNAFLASVLDLLPSNKYTVIYITTPSKAAPQPALAESQPYEMDALFDAPVHMELKRDLLHHKRASDSNITLPNGPLFERYQFLSPGLFMGLLAAFILLSILYVAVSGVASLKITYAAFDKQMGPTAQKNKAQ
ncbi:MAG: hypothetical protein Q9217_006278 [Psora testacea]